MARINSMMSIPGVPGSLVSEPKRLRLMVQALSWNWNRNQLKTQSRLRISLGTVPKILCPRIRTRISPQYFKQYGNPIKVLLFGLKNYIFSRITGGYPAEKYWEGKY